MVKISNLVKVSSSKETSFNLASGITLNHQFHIGNFREPMILSVLQKMLERQGIEVKWNYYLDDADQIRSEAYPLALKMEEQGAKGILKQIQNNFIRVISQDLNSKVNFISTFQKYKGQVFQELISKLLCKYFEGDLPSETTPPFTVFCPIQKDYQTTVTGFDPATKTITYSNLSDEGLQLVLTPGVFPGKVKYRFELAFKWEIAETHLEPINSDHNENWESIKNLHLGGKKMNTPHKVLYGRVIWVKNERLSKSSGSGALFWKQSTLFGIAPLTFLMVSGDLKQDFFVPWSHDFIGFMDRFDHLCSLYYSNDAQYFSDSSPSFQKANLKKANDYDVIVTILNNYTYSFKGLPSMRNCIQAASLCRTSSDFCSFFETYDSDTKSLLNRFESAKVWLELNPDSSLNLSNFEIENALTLDKDYSIYLFLNFLLVNFHGLLNWVPSELKVRIKGCMLRTGSDSRKCYSVLNKIFYGSSEGVPPIHRKMYYLGKDLVIDILKKTIR